MTTNIFEFAILALGSLFTMINPVGLLPVYMGATSGLSVSESRRIAIRATITALVTLIFFAFGGKLLFDFLGMSVDSLRMVGGFIFFGAGYEMFNNKLPKMKRDDICFDQAYDNAITPIGIPLICGPGAITTVMLLMSESGTAVNKTVLILSILLVIGVTLMVMLSAKKIMGVLGRSGRKVLMRITGLIVMVIAVDFFLGGVKPVIKELLCQ